MTPQAFRRRAVAACLSLALAAAEAAAAEPTAAERTLAEALFREGKRLMSEGRYAEACPKLAESLRLERGGGTLLNLAVCHQQEGKLATAWAEFAEALGRARRDGRREREQFALDHIAAIEKRLSFIVVTVDPGAPPGLEVRLDGVRLGRPTWSTSVPLDPGTHRLHAVAPGLRPWEVIVTVAAGERRRVLVPALAAGRHGPTPASAPSARGLGSRRTAALVLGGVGVASLTLTAVFGARAITKERDSDAHCAGTLCDAPGLGLNREARTAAVVADVTLGIGVVALGIGTYLWLSTRGDREGRPAEGRPRTESRLRVTPALGARGAGVAVGGEF
ncbi:MAG: hypothetical protein HY906_04590 [Deltaproteobacteria bacterium]|nr:hypothetical protein [Deltaproteobacteria bacterium]